MLLYPTIRQKSACQNHSSKLYILNTCILPRKKSISEPSMLETVNRPAATMGHVI